MVEYLRIGIDFLLELLGVVNRLGNGLAQLVASDPCHLDPVHQSILVGCEQVLGSAEVVVGIFSGSTITFARLMALQVQIKQTFVRASLAIETHNGFGCAIVLRRGHCVVVGLL